MSEIINVIDKIGNKHVFTGHIRFWHESNICRIYDVSTRISIASFTDPSAVWKS